MIVEATHRVSGVTGGGVSVAERVADPEVELAPAAGDARHRFATVAVQQTAPAIRRRIGERRLVGPPARSERVLLAVEVGDHVRAAVPEHPEPRARAPPQGRPPRGARARRDS